MKHCKTVIVNLVYLRHGERLLCSGRTYYSGLYACFGESKAHASPYFTYYGTSVLLLYQYLWVWCPLCWILLCYRDLWGFTKCPMKSSCCGHAKYLRPDNNTYQRCWCVFSLSSHAKKRRWMKSRCQCKPNEASSFCATWAGKNWGIRDGLGK